MRTAVTVVAWVAGAVVCTWLGIGIVLYLMVHAL